jgi:hypothetical protein
MVSSETQERAINLGKALVQELGLESSRDTLARWMSHYIAEQITIAENTTGEEKSKADEYCFKTILKLWNHRSSLPSNGYPFKNFEPIFKALNRFDPDNPHYYYFDNSRFRTVDDVTKPEIQIDEVQLWINVALSIDRAARILIDSAFNRAAHNALDEKTISWIENVAGISVDDENDISVITSLIGAAQESDPSQEEIDRRRQRLKSKIEQLDMFVELSRLLRQELVDEVENLSKNEINITTEIE